MPVRGKKSIADTYVSILPETSRVASEIAKAFRETDRHAREAGRRWREDINKELDNVRAKVNLDAAQAKADAERLKESIERKHVTIHVDVDKDRLGSELSGGLAATLAALPGQVASTAQGAGQQIGGAINEGVSAGIKGGASAGSAGGPITAAVLATLALSATGALVQLGGVAASAAGSLGVLPAALSSVAVGMGTVMLATQGFTDALGNLRDPEKFAESLQTMAPAAQQAALAIQALLPAWDHLQQATANAFFANGADMINKLAAQYLPAVEQLTTRVAGAINAGMSGVFDTLMRPDMQAAVSSTFNNIATAFQIASQAAAPFTQAFAQIMQVGSTFLPGIATAITDIANRFAAFIAQASADGSLQKWIGNGLDTLGQLGNLVLYLVQKFAELAPIGERALPGIIAAIEGIANALVAASPLLAAMAPMWNNVAGSANFAAGVFTSISNFLTGTLGPVIEASRIAFDTAWTWIGNKVQTVWDAMRPILDAMSRAIHTVLDPLLKVADLAGRFLPGSTVGGTAVAAGGGVLPTPEGGYGMPTQGGLPGAQAQRRGLSVAPLPESGMVSPVPSGGYYVPPPPPPKISGGGSSAPAVVAAQNGLQPNAVALERAIRANFPQVKDIGGWRPPDGYNEHSSGTALDIMVGGDKALGDRINQWLLANSNTFGLQYDLWQQRQWNPDGSTSGMEDRGSPTQNHRDHVHARVKGGAAAGGPLTSPAAGVTDNPATVADAALTGSLGTPQNPMYVILAGQGGGQGGAASVAGGGLTGGGGSSSGQKKMAGQNHVDALAGSLLGDIAQVFGLDGSVFSDPTQWGITKLLSGAANWATQDTSGGASGGGGGGSLLSFLPQAIGDLRLGGQQDANAPFMGGMPGYGEGNSLAAGAQFIAQQTGQHGSGAALGANPGPGNDYSNSGNLVINQYGGNTGDALNSAQGFQVARARQAVRQ